jgi:hypothetical protein
LQYIETITLHNIFIFVFISSANAGCMVQEKICHWMGFLRSLCR